ncbi:hypothetical protein Purlil1_431 [Purpureocillium lilacinum]|uniref:Uncharacterized protein n=1 Tax=Purpureocillium lilacinum TaxID=33203 RepID=A0ABR0CH09_PURLI|nr:hypothetical protein Purlil1_431 [Purpureocillium lilacinum]
MQSLERYWSTRSLYNDMSISGPFTIPVPAVMGVTDGLPYAGGAAKLEKDGLLAPDFKGNMTLQESHESRIILGPRADAGSDGRVYKGVNEVNAAVDSSEPYMPGTWYGWDSNLCVTQLLCYDSIAAIQWEHKCTAYWGPSCNSHFARNAAAALSPCSIKERANRVRRPALAPMNVHCVSPMLSSSVSHVSRARLPVTVNVRGKGMMRKNIRGPRLRLTVYYFDAPSIWFEGIMDGTLPLEIDGMTSLDCYEMYHFSPPPIETVRVCYYVARCSRIGHDWASKLVHTPEVAFEEYVESNLREFLTSIEDSGVRPQLRVSHGEDERSFNPEWSSVNEAVDLAWPLLAQVVQDTLQWASGYEV